MRRNQGELTPGSVELATRSQGTLRRRIDHLPGGPQQPLSDADLDAKVAECMALGARPLAPERIERLAARVAAIEEVKDMARWFDGI